MLSPYLTQCLDHLRQPRLCRPLCPNMLRDGLPRPGVLEGVDHLLCEDAVARILAWEMPRDLPVGQQREDRWRAVSSLQKAIRRGDVRAAMVAAHACFGMDAAYLRRRLVVCAVEDVCLGNLYAVAATLALAGDRPSRRLAGELKTSVWLAAQLAGGWKDRSACNMCVLVDLNRDLHPTIPDWERLPDEALVASATDTGRPVEERMLAAWLLAGTKRYRGANLPPSNDRTRWRLMRLMVQSEMPLILYWLADRAAIRGADAMFIAFLPIWQMLRDTEDEVRLLSRELPRDPGVGGLLACAYDMYTREGRMALSRFQQHPPVEAALRPARPEERTSLLHAAVFVAEGGQLNLRVSLPGLDAVHHRAVGCELTYFGMPGVAAQTELISTVRREIGVLNRYRRHLAGERFPPTLVTPEPARAAPTAFNPNTPERQLLPLHEAPRPITMAKPPTTSDPSVL